MRAPSQERVEQEVEIGGTPRSSPLFQIKVREARILFCQNEIEFQPDCRDCPKYNQCTLGQEGYVDRTYRLPEIEQAAQKEQSDAPKNPWLNFK